MKPRTLILFTLITFSIKLAFAQEATKRNLKVDVSMTTVKEKIDNSAEKSKEVLKAQLEDKKEASVKASHLFAPLTPLSKESIKVEVVPLGKEKKAAPAFKILALIKVTSKKNMAVLSSKNKEFTINKTSHFQITRGNKTWRYKVIDIDMNGVSLQEQKSLKALRIK
jgi:hypothetical protein